MAHRIEVFLEDPTEWVSAFDPRDSTLFVETVTPPSVRDTVRIDLVAGKGGPRVIFRGQVIACRKEKEGPLQPGCIVALSPFEREKINYLNGYIRGGLLDLRKKNRIPVRLPVTYGGFDGPCTSYTRDINNEGTFIITDTPLPEDSKVNLIISFPKSAPINLSGLVSHTVVIEDEDTPGMGIIFQFSRNQATKFHESMKSLEKAFVTGILPEEYLL